MRNPAVPFVLAFAAASALVTAGCQGDLMPMGAGCSSASDCAGNLCLRGKCTAACVARTDCKVGFDCGLVDAADPGPTCYAPSYDVALKGGYGYTLDGAARLDGTPCSTVAADKNGTACTMAPSPCAAGFSCLSSLRCDPNAYCTAACATDSDCPMAMFCGASPADSKKKVCLRRAHCSPCALDDQCPRSWLCATGKGGERFCAKPCNSDKDCPQPANDETGNFPLGMPFQSCQKDVGHGQKLCKPPSGRCHGPSALPSVKGDNTTCSGCRLGFPDDCQNGTTCFVDEFTTERFCTVRCSVTIVCTDIQAGVCRAWEAKAGTDTCNALSPDLHCHFGANPNCTKTPCDLTGSLCTADPLALTCYPLPPMM